MGEGLATRNTKRHEKRVDGNRTAEVLDARKALETL